MWLLLNSNLENLQKESKTIINTMNGSDFAIVYVPSYAGYTLVNCFNNNLEICDSIVTGFAFNPSNGLYHVTLSSVVPSTSLIQLMCVYTYNKSGSQNSNSY